jgi:6-phosphofructokinase 1
MTGGGIVESGEADAYGHRKLGGIGQITGEALKKRTGVDIVSQNLGYLMRAGAPDALDRMVAANYASLAIEEIAAGRFGQMAALQKGVYCLVSASSCIEGKRQVDVAELYDTQEYRLKVGQVLGKPMFLY